MDVLEDMKEKAEEQLSTLRMEWTKTKQNFNLLKQSLEDQIANDNKDKKEQENAKSDAKETKTTSEEELSATNKLLANTQASLSDGNSNCMQMAADHDASMAGRKEELSVIAQAEKILHEATAGAT